MCNVLSVSCSGYYAWKKRPASERKQENTRLLAKIHRIHQTSGETYGSPRIYQALNREGISCSESRVSRLMREDGICARRHKRFKTTTNSKHDLPVSSNLLLCNPNIPQRDSKLHRRNFSPKKPNRVWAGDITYIWTKEGWLYLAMVIDLFSRSVVGWSMDKQMTSQLVVHALSMAIKRRKPSPGIIFHSDRGAQYASNQFQSLLARHGIYGSMSRKGNCWDNAVSESFFGSLKTELVAHQKYLTRSQARQSIFYYVEMFYNRRRLHSTLGYRSPREFEETYFTNEETRESMTKFVA